MKNNIFSNARQYVLERKQAGEVFISAAEIKSWVITMCDVEESERNEFFDFYVNYNIRVALNINHCYSHERGAGRFVNVDACKDKAILGQLLLNAETDIDGDSKRYAVIKRRLRELDMNQTFFDLDNPTAPIQTVGEALGAAM